jgi:ribonucleotide reductase beta subunit family protein with ferritin-like domain
VVFPIAYHKLWKHYKEAHEKFWHSEQFNFKLDKSDWKKLSDEENNFLSHTLGFLATHTSNLNEILVTTFATEIKIPEPRAFYGFQVAIMNIHLEVYSQIINMFVDLSLKDQLCDSLFENEVIKNKMNWVNRYLRCKNEPFSTRIVAFACCESILMSGSLCSIFWLQKRGLLPTLCASNQEISRDKTIHSNFSCEIHNTLLFPCPNEIMSEVVIGAVEVEKEFVSKKLSTSKIGLESELVCKYIEFVADELLVKLNQKRIYGTENPFDFVVFEKGFECDLLVKGVKSEDEEFKMDEAF